MGFINTYRMHVCILFLHSCVFITHVALWRWITYAKLRTVARKIEERKAWKVIFITCEHLFGKNCCCFSLINVSFSDPLEDSRIAGGNNDAFSSFFKGLSLYRISALSCAYACNILPNCQVWWHLEAVALCC
jgi:hypothetical protein